MGVSPNGETTKWLNSHLVSFRPTQQRVPSPRPIFFPKCAVVPSLRNTAMTLDRRDPQKRRVDLSQKATRVLRILKTQLRQTGEFRTGERGLAKESVLCRMKFKLGISWWTSFWWRFMSSDKVPIGKS